MPVDPQQVRELFLASVEQPPDDRERYLTDLCGSDQELRDAVERLLAANEQPARILEASLTEQIHRPLEGTARASKASAGESHDPVEPLATTDNAGVTATGPLADYPPQRTIGFVPGRILAGRYILQEVLGEGGMGTVYRADQTEPVKRQVALKVIKIGMDSRTVLARFNAERQALARHGPSQHREGVRRRHDRRRAAVLRDGASARRADHGLLRFPKTHGDRAP